MSGSAAEFGMRLSIVSTSAVKRTAATSSPIVLGLYYVRLKDLTVLVVVYVF